MGFGDYFHHGQQIDFETAGTESGKHYAAQITELTTETLQIKIIGLDTNCLLEIHDGSKAIIWGEKNEFKYSVHVTVESIDAEYNILLKHIPTRSHLRVDSYLVFSYKVIKEDEYIARKRLYTQQMRLDSDSYIFMPSRVITDDSEVQTNIPPEIIYEIQSIHRKLDFIIKQIGQSEEDNVFKKQPEEVNLSGSGMRFKTYEMLKSGVYIEVKLVLPIASGVIIDFIGQVVRCKSFLTEENGMNQQRHETAITFAAINEDDREFIIRYVFKRQRELLRAEEG